MQGAKFGYYSKPNNSTLSGAEQQAIFEDAINTLRAEGATVTEIAFTPPSNPTPSTVLAYEFKRDLNNYLQSLGPSSPIKTIDDVAIFIIDYLAANPALDGPFKYGKARVDASRIIDLSPSSAATTQYLADRALDILNSRTLGIDKYLNDHELDAILFSGSSGAGIGARAGYPTIIVPAGYQSLNNLNPLGLSFLARAYEEDKLIGYAYDFEQAHNARISPLLTPPLAGETIVVPGPLPLAGVGLAFSWTRRLRRRLGVVQRGPWLPGPGMLAAGRRSSL